MEYYDFPVEINGLAVHARFSRENIDRIFLPLLRNWTAMQKEKRRRILVMLAAPPGTGKTTLALFLAHLSRETPGLCPVTAIGMDGFHRRQEYLLAHTTLRGGKAVPMVQVKGAPETFDLDALRERVALAASGADCPWPEYDRLLHNPVENVLRVQGDIVLLEGNYLLLDADGWRELRRYADSTVRIAADPALLRKRLIERKTASGTPRAEAERFVDFSDLPNAELCLGHSLDAALTLSLSADGSYLAESAKIP